ncbi:restriction endonuclease subunit S [Streptococcus ruminantium]|uniref:restriction endonuclease subunit S n=1 Tax=Streptococcus ruminantium TaxID=1917441 RepID=UPI0012DCAB7B|nr:restriction endonuclease subunit S [Streptococcus ruminantium]
MDSMITKKFALSELFSNKRGDSKLTKSYCNKHQGKYEVYTGSTKTSFAFIDTYAYSTPLLTYTTDGEYAGSLDILEGKYNVGGHRAILTPLIDGLPLLYFKFALQKTFFENVKRGDVPSLTWTSISKQSLVLPVNSVGEIDIKELENISAKYQKLFDIKQKLYNQYEKINLVDIDIFKSSSLNRKVFLVENLLDTKGGNSKLTLKHINQNQGEFPVYSAKTKGDIVKGYCNTFDFDIECIRVTRNGNAGVPFYQKKHKFSISEDARIYYPKEKYTKLLDLEYLVYALKEGLKYKDFSWNNKAGKAKINKVPILLPVTHNGEIDLEAQKQLLRILKDIDRVKSVILSNLKDLYIKDIEIEGLM